MSRIIDRLNDAARGVSQPMGFRAARSEAARARMLLIASLTNVENATVDNIAGADAAVIYVTKSGPGASFFSNLNEGLQDTPWGCRVNGTSPALLSRLLENKCDFIIFPMESAVLPAGKFDPLGRVLQIEPSMGEAALRAVNELPVDAVLASGEPGNFLEWDRLLSLQKLTLVLRKPVLTTVPLDVKPDELRTLWEAGVDGVLIVSDEPSDEIVRLRQEIEKFSRTSHRRGKAEALLPGIGSRTETEAEEEEDWEDE